MIQRYFAGDLRPDQKESWKTEDGIFVLYADHLTALAEKEKQCDLYLRTNKGHLDTILALGKQIAALTTKIERLREELELMTGRYNDLLKMGGL